ncbi:MAG: transcriptional repressor NrdR [Clostridia bacterium]|nr:transcriptional repressor NrdR [Clostridia bacterium]
MRCPNCGSADLRVIDSRPAENNAIKRRRECAACKSRYTTYETIETYQLIVVKKDGTKELFDKAKLLSGLLKACQKRPVDAEKLADEIESELRNGMQHEVTTASIGEKVMEKLKEVDGVAYVRFASVYREFKDIETFMKELDILREKRD